jgi:hypothetical protein
MTAGGEAFTLLTTEPSPDVARIHDRQMVVLKRSDWSAWLKETGNDASLLRALPTGSRILSVIVSHPGSTFSTHGFGLNGFLLPERFISLNPVWQFPASRADDRERKQVRSILGLFAG